MLHLLLLYEVGEVGVDSLHRTKPLALGAEYVRGLGHGGGVCRDCSPVGRKDVLEK